MRAVSIFRPGTISDPFFGNTFLLWGDQMSEVLKPYVGKADDTRAELEEELDKIKGKIEAAGGTVELK